MRNNEVRELVEQIRGEIANHGRDNVVPMLRDLEELVGEYGHLDDIVDTDLVDELVQSRLSDGGWQGVACMLDGIQYMNDEYYMFDGYGNLRCLETRDLEIALEDILYNVDLDEYDEEEDEE